MCNQQHIDQGRLFKSNGTGSLAIKGIVGKSIQQQKKPLKNY